LRAEAAYRSAVACCESKRAPVAKASKSSIRPAAVPVWSDAECLGSGSTRSQRAAPDLNFRVNPKPPAVTPDPLSIGEALQRSEPLARLREALRDSNARFAAIRPAIPRAMRAHVAPGPADAEGWSLLAENASVAAKLRQLGPRFEELLREAGWPVGTVRIKVTPPAPR
jgi:hypothetical protein